MNIHHFLLHILLMSLTRASAIEVQHSEIENATDEEFSLLSTTPYPDLDTDLTLGKISDQITTGNVIQSYEVKDFDNLTTQLSSTGIPQNHKNLTPYVSSIELPPLLNQYNAYQQQYKTYYKQKNEYGYKPVKFEANNEGNRHVTHGLGSYLDENDERHRYEELKYEREPFPYIFESERLPLLGQSPWTEVDQTQNEIDDYAYHTPYDAKYETNVSPKERVYGWKKALKLFTALVPLGILLATITPSVISINSTTEQNPSRQRSLNDETNLNEHDLRNALGLDHSGDIQCQMRSICEVSRQGKNSNRYDRKSFWLLATRTPDVIAEQLGVKELFQAIREDKCGVYKCEKPKRKAAMHRFTKKGKKKVTAGSKL